ncbi:glycosyltransferase family 1 protein [Halalkalibacter krulwichiae]|uniref:Putative glycosyltransferase EpsF n=1 Tax=Halalkalibacter krulwichiae TaxID=199441 RepID=A0A1X9MMM7_9BACI|nr:glycosyltransferase family 1 protein [Halalkalibacter krulwichiae]ARK32452.1 Putative glycosyltransferase EpsF [Halalkalibacter krulwichiae]
MSHKVKVLHICGSITSSGGVGAFLMNYYKNVDINKVQFDFLTHNNTEEQLVKEINDMGGSVIKITPKSISIWKNIYEAFKIINKRSPHEIIHIHTASTTSFLYLLIAKLAGKKKRIVHSHATDLEKPKGSFQHRIHNLLRPIMLSLSTDLFACSEAAGDWLFGVERRSKVRLVNNAIDSKKFLYNKRKAEQIRNSMNIDDKLVIGNIGRFSYPKNHHFIIDIFNEVVKVNPNALLLLIGSGELIDEIKQKVFELKLNNKVKFLGVRNDIPDLLNAMNVFLLPSKFEGLPVALIEAQASGLKIYATDTITSEVEVTELVTRLPISESPRFWAEKIIQDSNQLVRKSTYEEIVKSGYDIKSNAKWLENFYFNKTFK